MNCTNPKMKQLVSLYQFDLLPEKQKIRVEANVMSVLMNYTVSVRQ